MESVHRFYKKQSIMTKCCFNRRSTTRSRNMGSWKLVFFVLFSSTYCYQNLNIITPCSSWIIRELPTRTSSRRHITRYSAVTMNDEDEIEIDDDDDNAKSLFGTKEYWDELYQGRGDFPSDEYQWYFGFEKYGKLVMENLPSKNEEILLPGIGNDPILLDLLQKGYTKLTASDYSEYAIERQIDLLSYERYPFSTEEEEIEEEDHDNDSTKGNDRTRPTLLLQMDARKMKSMWTNKFDAIIEKGALDAIHLSGDGNFERAVKEFERTLKPGGILISVSGVVPPELRKEVFTPKNWSWIRDGTDDLQAGCFVLKKKYPVV
ncbi:MAG: SAM-dependent methyltransferase [Bacillariaceae sp.]|jgi:SAM-dependent methyltransferase